LAVIGTIEIVPFQSDERQPQILRLAALAQDDSFMVATRMTGYGGAEDDSFMVALRMAALWWCRR
jgi:hypothetical protein